MNAFTEAASRAAWMGVSERTAANRQGLQRLTSVPKDALNTFLAIDWLNGVAQFRKAEIEHLCNPDPLEILSRAILAQLAAQGETLVLGIKEDGLLPEAGFTLEDVQAT